MASHLSMETLSKFNKKRKRGRTCLLESKVKKRKLCDDTHKNNSKKTTSYPNVTKDLIHEKSTILNVFSEITEVDEKCNDEYHSDEINGIAQLPDAAVLTSEREESSEELYCPNQTSEFVNDLDSSQCTEPDVLNSSEKMNKDKQLKSKVNTFTDNLGHLGHFYHECQGEQVLFLSMLPEHCIMLSGIGYVKCCLGSVTILGYRMRTAEKRAIFAPTCEAPIMVQGNKVTTPRTLGEKKFECFNISQKIKKLKVKPTVVNQKFKNRLEKMCGYLKNKETFHETKWSKLNINLGQQEVTVLLLRQFDCSTLEKCLQISPGVPGAISTLSWTSNTGTNAVGLAPLVQQPIETPPVHVPHTWSKAASKLCIDYLTPQTETSQGRGMRVLVIGPPRSGKNTLCRYLLNSLLSCQVNKEKPEASSSLKHSPRVCLMDMDLQCPEQSLPGAVSCARYTHPLLGPAHRYGLPCPLRDESEMEEQDNMCKRAVSRMKKRKRIDKVRLGVKTKQIFLGSDQLVKVSYQYCAAAVNFIDIINKKHSNEPVIVNSHGILDSMSQMLNIELIRIIDPTHVIHILGSLAGPGSTNGHSSEYINYRINKDSFYGGGHNLALQSLENEQKISRLKSSFNYKFSRVPSMNQENRYQCNRGHVRDVCTTAYYSALWPQTAVSISGNTCERAIEVPFSSFAVLAPKCKVSSNLQALSCGKVIGLCFVHRDYIIDTEPNYPKEVFFPETDGDYENGVCIVDTKRVMALLGWGIVRSLDTTNRTLSIYVPGRKDVMKRVNCLALQEVANGFRFRNLFREENCNMPDMDWPGHNSKSSDIDKWAALVQ